MSVNSFGAKSSLDVNGTGYEIFSLDAVPGSEKLPFSLKVLLENLLRTEGCFANEGIVPDPPRQVLP